MAYIFYLLNAVILFNIFKEVNYIGMCSQKKKAWVAQGVRSGLPNS